MAVDKNKRSFGNRIVALEMELTSGTWYTLWAPQWIVRGESWQAFLGDDDHIYAFESPAQLLGYLNAGGRNDLAEHAKWKDFSRKLVENLSPEKFTTVSLVELPRELAKRPGYDSTLKVTQGFDLLASFGNVLGISSINNWFHSFSILHNTRRGAEHYASSNGLEEWTGVGRTVLDRWKSMTAEVVPFLTTPEVSEEAVRAAQAQLDQVKTDREAKAAAAAEKANKDKEKQAEATDPYDSTLWAQSGIDPIRVSLNGQYVYTLRTYVGNRPVFLGHNGEIFTFPNSRSLVRWIIDAPQHDLEELATWGDLVTAANAGELEIKVHDTNQYAFTGLRQDIGKNVDEVDTDQLSRAYELLADAADWAQDDGVNKVLLAYPRLQNYLAYMLGSPSSTTPSAPFDEEAKGWQALEEGLIRRFSKF
ncbi:hypothetical protein F7230_03750 [Corynebacterium sp. 320]|uniref:hypothetical protein n=1 Tax=Corynebacterium TaxID=1716 RepID=UPI00125CB8EA|nr:MULTISPECIES: hypothetical protein [Corynebacterium]KAB1504209.1 hypothetical protein F7230_03750 [Corynebacterium sp. 320]KAB1552691.1 hypothetical protein F7233_02840 [Corynebacterium sp. 321]KAB1554091.1 hypothetical protein F7232_03745 [Corynebacterium sp. 319]KAB3528345.1 hypothetical protein F8354_03750 [Corynebacterium sp. 250]KAB3540166.1 hypothetical protein F8390_02585 [Corynebacterium sp. 366]